MQVGEWENSLEFDNWGNPLPTASASTVAAWKAAKNDEKMQELDNKSTYPYDLSVLCCGCEGATVTRVKTLLMLLPGSCYERLLTRTPCVF